MDAFVCKAANIASNIFISFLTLTFRLRSIPIQKSGLGMSFGQGSTYIFEEPALSKICLFLS